MTAVRLSVALYACVLAGIIYLANTGHGAQYWSFLKHLPFGDKFGHLGLLATFSLLLNLALRCRRLGPLLLGSCLLFTAMLLEELSQQFLPHRSYDLVDMLANLVGIFIGGALSRSVYRRVFPAPPPAKP